MRILVGAVTNKEPEILKEHLESLKNQKIPEHVVLDYWYLCDQQIPQESLELLEQYDIAFDYAAPKPKDAQYSVSETTHHWNKSTFYWLGEQKQRLLTKGKEYDAVFLADTDLLMDSTTLQSLIEADKDIVSAVFWTKWSPGMPSLPQVWMEHPYEMQGRGVEAHEHLSNAASRQLWKVAGLGACTLIKSNCLDYVRYYPPIEGLPQNGMWQGEDRTFCITANKAHIELWADGWPSIFHIYRPSDLKNVEMVKRGFGDASLEVPGFGDYVSLKLTPMEEGNLAGFVYTYRGRLGTGELLPSLERVVGGLRVGEERFAKIKFPVWWEIPEYRGQEKHIRVQLIDAKKNLPHPHRDDLQDFGVYYE